MCKLLDIVTMSYTFYTPCFPGFTRPFPLPFFAPCMTGSLSALADALLGMVDTNLILLASCLKQGMTGFVPQASSVRYESKPRLRRAEGC
jgi:hypothetical protein